MYPDQIVHYSRSKPFRSITNHPPGNREELIKSLTESDIWGIERFSDPNYLSRRIHVEENLRKDFSSMGGQPQLKNPIYFYLGRHRQWEKNSLNKGYSIKLKYIPKNAITFTYGDSLIGFNEDYRRQSGEKYQSPLCKKIFLKNDLESLMTNLEDPYWEPLKIEAQLWIMPDESRVQIINR